jgi:hypothetical protein
MPTPPVMGLIIFGVILAGAFVGWAAGRRLPSHHATDETKSVVSVSMGVVATISALVLGLLISNANTSFNARNNEVTRLSADLLRLDQLLRRYGPEADPARETLRQYAERKTADLFPENPGDPVRLDNDRTYELLLRLEESILALRTADPREQWLLGQSMTLAADIGNTRWLLLQQEAGGLPKPLLVLVTFWLTLLFASFALFAPRHLTSALALVLCAMAVSGAIEMILELQDPFDRLVRISPRPMRNAVHALRLDEIPPAYGSSIPIPDHQNWK